MMAPIRLDAGWDKKPQTNSTNSNLPEKYYQIHYNGHALMFTVDVLGKGVQPDNKSCPMWICLHGGGTTQPDNNNDCNWSEARGQGGLFRTLAGRHAAAHGPIIMVCPRGVSTTERDGKAEAFDDWNLHFRDESYVLIEQMIIGLLQPNAAIDTPYSVDSNSVFLWGFSAGGDGAFNLGARLPDRFAGVVAAAGHPSGAPLINCANLEMLLQVGERDVVNANNVLIPRAKIYLQEVRARLLEFRRAHGGDRGGLYSFDCMVVQTDTAPPGNPYYYHNSWNEDDKRTILKATPKDDAYVASWLNQVDLRDDKIQTWLANRIWTANPPPEWYSSNVTINPLQFFAGTKYRRNPTPNRVIWDLKPNGRPPRPRVAGHPEAVPPGWEKRMLYWLYVRQSPLDAESLKLIEKDAEDVATYVNGSARIIHVARPNLHMGYLLKESWITGGHTVTLRYKESGTATTKDIPLGSLAVQPTIKAQTRELSGDLELEFAAMVYFTFISNTWGAAVAHSLDG
jgi:predicted esterase